MPLGNNRRKEYFAQYIESLDNQPAILAVKEKVGNSNLYTMIISSNSGADYTVERIARKIKNILNCDPNVAQQIGRKVSDAKDLAPSLVTGNGNFSNYRRDTWIDYTSILQMLLFLQIENGISG